MRGVSSEAAMLVTPSSITTVAFLLVSRLAAYEMASLSMFLISRAAPFLISCEQNIGV